MKNNALRKLIGPLIFLVLLLTGVGSLATLNHISAERNAEIARKEEEKQLAKQNSLLERQRESQQAEEAAEEEVTLELALEDFNKNDASQVALIQDLSKELFEEDYLSKRQEIKNIANKSSLNIEELGYLFLPKQPASETHVDQKATQIDVPLILQTDPAWADKAYGPGIEEHIGKTGCAIATLAMVEATYGDNQTSPHDILEWSKDTYYVPEIGTSWTIFEAFADKYDYNFHNYGSNFHAAMQAIDEGKLIVASVDPGYFTDVGHILIIRGYDPERHLVYVNDPNDDPAKMYSLQGIDEEIFLKDGLNYWSFDK